ncbi:MAG: DUF4065 domain-containing protein [Candidatus Lokiarchaeota archaeon]|nr:DUF4065 domain-containing protein [Candidatus Lokiarchaeota archaeon]
MPNLSENINLPNLILSIVSYVRDRGGYVTKTKLIKFLYLIDVEYYRKNKLKLTNFDWIFYKFGPYTKQFEEIYSSLSQGDLKIDRKIGNDYDADIITSDLSLEIHEVINNPSTSLLIKKILNRWSQERLSKILDYVYFETEPMENAKKLQPLDFTTIMPELEEEFRLNKSKLKAKKLKSLRDKLKNQLDRSHQGIPLIELFPATNYGESYIEDIFKMNSGDII